MILSIWRPMGVIVRALVLILLIVQMYLCLELRRNRLGRGLRAAMLADLLATAFLLFSFLYHDTAVKDIVDEGRWPAPVPEPPEIPLAFWLVVLFALGSAAFAAAAAVRLRRFVNEHPTASAVKESIDLLPEGIAFAGADGRVALSNLSINRLSRAMTGKPLTELGPFAEKKQLTLPDGSAVYQLSTEQITADGRLWTQLIAADVTEQARVNRELQAKNDKLREINMRLVLFNRQAERLTAARELLNARMRVHNESGHLLLTCRHYLEHPESLDEAALLEALKDSNTNLLREREEEVAEDPLKDALEVARAIGVHVSIDGFMPQQIIQRKLLGAAIVECATNAVKHTDGSELRVSVRKDSGCLRCVLVTNGEAPTQQIREGGGLHSLRELIERSGGTMEVRADPAFRLTVTVPPER